MEKRIVYLDHSATTAVKPEVFDAMMPYFIENYGNPSSIYTLGRKTKNAIEDARNKVANAINATDKEIYFTGSGTEADNWAIKGIAFANEKRGKHIITSKIEHHAVLHTCQYLEKKGFEVTYLDVDENGLISLEQLKKSIREDTILVSIMFANNEIGTIQPIEEIGKITREKSVIFHTDAVQAMGNVNIDVQKMNIDLLSMSAHKFYGPKGVGALYVRKGIRLKRFMHGGAQEKAKRASTENVPGIVGMGKAIELAVANMDEYNDKLNKLRQKAYDRIIKEIPFIRLNGHKEKRLPGNLNFSFEFIEGEALLLMLDLKGIQASSGSACTSGALDPSHVLLSIGLPHEIAHGSLRITFGEENTEEDVDYLVDELKKVVSTLRKMSPLYEDYLKNNSN